MLMAQGYVVGVVLGLRRSVRGIFLSVRDGGGVQKDTTGECGGPPKKERKKGLKI